jgi:4'-phosphopantetheinyl transferase
VSNTYKIIVIKAEHNFNFSQYLYLLPKTEQQRVFTFRQKRDQVFAFCSALFKFCYIPQLLKISPQDLILRTNEFGKPYVVNNLAFKFNLSHSGEYVVFAYSFDHEIGVDVELIDYSLDYQFKDNFFSNFSANLVQNHADFFIIWTKAEAYFKCVGSGLKQDDLNQLQINTQLEQQINNCNIISTFIDQKKYIISVALN